MADRFPTRYPNAGNDADASAGPVRNEGDPLAELARLIGQTDPMADFARGARASSHGEAQPQPEYEPQFAASGELPPGPPSWVRHRAGWRKAAPAAFEADDRYDEASRPVYDEAPYDDGPEPDPHRYDEALYGHADPALVDDAPGLGADGYGDGDYAYDEAYDDEEPQRGARRGGKRAVVAILLLAVVGTGGAYAYRSLSGSLMRPAEPPVIKADTAPIKVVPPTQNAERKLVQDRLASAGGTERLVPREEAPVDVASKTQGQPRVVFPPLTRNAAPATVPAAASAAAEAATGPEPRKIRTVVVRPDQSIAAPTAAANAAPAPRVAAEAPDSQTRTASISPMAAEPAAAGSGGFLVQVSSQRSEADARASYRLLQGKFPSVLGNHAPVIRRADLGAKGVHYRAMVGPFASSDQAAQVCGDLKAAGGQCFVQRN